jgi:dolichol-phosphate mannosyltransferase
VVFPAHSKLPFSYDLTVIIPTFNEEINIAPMIQAIETVCRQAHIHEEIVVVDDSSADRTVDVVKDIQNSMDNLSLIVRTRNPGLSPSLYEGIQNAKAPLVQCIDCDFSHPPEKIPVFYQHLHNQGYDMVIGSRYIDGGEVRNWSFYRELLSFGAALLGRVLIPNVKDSGSGFFAVNTRILDGVTLTPRGFRMGFEILGKSNWTRVKEISIVFKDRESGESKLRWRIVLQYLIQWVSILEYNLIKKECNSIARAWKHFLRN